jgi:hypothetical protein
VVCNLCGFGLGLTKPIKTYQRGTYMFGTWSQGFSNKDLKPLLLLQMTAMVTLVG